jgi:hypothetical protein
MASNAVKGPHSGPYEDGPVTAAGVHWSERPLGRGEGRQRAGNA